MRCTGISKLEAFHASILEMTLEGTKQQVLLRDVQMHPFKQLVLHVDFQRVDKNKKIHMKVPLHFINAENCPGVKVRGGVVNHMMNEVDIQCLPDDLPEFIEVNLDKPRARPLDAYQRQSRCRRASSRFAASRRTIPAIVTVARAESRRDRRGSGRRL